MKVETKVGLLFVVAVAMVAAFAYYLGVLNPFSNTHDFYLTYNFAGGIEVGSPVRVMGIKVGKVKEIIFDPQMKDENGEEVKLKVHIGIAKKAWPTIRQDSKFFINLAGVIGEKYIEVTPGTLEHAELVPGGTKRGEDPPRIDQLISQSYGLAGKLLDFVEKNKGSLTDTIAQMNSLVSNLNKTLVLLDKTTKNKEINELLNNIIGITGDLSILTKRLRGAEADKTLELLHRLIWRLEDLDAKNIRKFLQEEGVKAKIF